MHDAGFSVALLAPPNALAAKSRHVDRVTFFPPELTICEWVDSVAAAVRAADPRLIVPCDDLTTRLLHSIVLAAPPDLKANTQVELSALIRESLGDPAFYETSVDKIRLPPLAASLRVRSFPGPKRGIFPTSLPLPRITATRSC